MSRRRIRWQPTAAEVALATMAGDANIRRTARDSAEAKLRELAHARLLSVGEYAESIQRAARK